MLGIQRRARMLRTRLGELRLEPGDVLLLLGLAGDIERLRGDPDVLVMEWSASEMPLVRKAPLAALIFAAIVAPAALDLVPIVVTALLGVLALIAHRLPQRAPGGARGRPPDRADHRRLARARHRARGDRRRRLPGGAWCWRRWPARPPARCSRCCSCSIALLTNVLTNNAAAVLFTPVAVNLAHSWAPRCSPSRSRCCSAPAARSRRRSAIRPTSW